MQFISHLMFKMTQSSSVIKQWEVDYETNASRMVLPIVRVITLLKKYICPQRGCFWEVIYKEHGCIIIFFKEKNSVFG